MPDLRYGALRLCPWEGLLVWLSNDRARSRQWRTPPDRKNVRQLLTTQTEQLQESAYENLLAIQRSVDQGMS